MQLTEKEKERYNRQIQLDEIGEKDRHCSDKRKS